MKNGDKAKFLQLLERDKAEINEPSRAAALAEFKRVAEEYFEVDGAYEFRITEEKGGTRVTFSFRAVRVKNFTPLT